MNKKNKMLKTKYLRMALAEFGDRGELLDNAYKELYKLEEYVREHEGLSRKHWTLCDRPQRNELREIAVKMGFKFNDDPSWDFAWVRLGTSGTGFSFDFEFTETPDAYRLPFLEFKERVLKMAELAA